MHYLQSLPLQSFVFAAAFGSTASVALFHIAGITPEAPNVETALAQNIPLERLKLTTEGLAEAWRALDSSGQPGKSDQIELVAVGNPHLSLTVRSGRVGFCCLMPDASYCCCDGWTWLTVQVFLM